jgi:rare lipoprotein A
LLTACGTTQRGGYYQNDGPPDRTSSDIAAVSDAVPRIEPFLARANRPYVALGRSYTPLTTDVAFRERGAASWYVRVTGIRSRQSVIVRVNDRGPFKSDRIIDLSYAAASRLGFVAAGTGQVEIERITYSQIASGEWRNAEH